MDGATAESGKSIFDAGQCRMLHTMVRVLDLDRSLDFYCRILGMKVLMQRDIEVVQRRLAFVGYGEETKDSVIELIYDGTHKEAYTHGSGYGHVAIAVNDVNAACKSLEGQGVKIARPPARPPGGRFMIAYIKDPDGYEIELVERA